MITGVVAQEPVPLPRGTFVPRLLHADNDNFFGASVTSGLDQRLFAAPPVDSDDEFFDGEMPLMLNSDAVLESWLNGEEVYGPRIQRDHRLVVLLCTDVDGFLHPDIRIPGTLQPPFYANDDVVFSTPLILDSGMLRAEVTFDFEAIYDPLIDAAQTFFPLLFRDNDVFPPPLARGGVIGPPLVSHDDHIFSFASLTRMAPPLVIDTARPFFNPTSFDGVPQLVTLTPDLLTATKIDDSHYSGARSTLLKNTGKFYFEITVDITRGYDDACGILLDGATYTQMQQGRINKTTSMVTFSEHDGTYVLPGFTAVLGAITSNQQAYGGWGLGPFVGGEIVGVAVNISDRLIWFRKNGGPWNHYPVPRIPGYGNVNGNPGADPTTNAGGATIGGGDFAPALFMGAGSGTDSTGSAGSRQTANFGASRFANPPPAGYLPWEPVSPFGQPVNGDSIGAPVLGIPASLDGMAVEVTMSNGNRTATHLTANTSCGVVSRALQNYGRYYFEVTIGLTHGALDTVGVLLSSGSIADLVNGASCANVYPSGDINPGSFTISSYGTGDVISVAFDLSSQTTIAGGLAWFRKNAGDWNGIAGADPASGTGGLPLQGVNFKQFWAPAVGFGGSGASVGDSMTANFGQVPFIRRPPNGFGIWSSIFNDFMRTVVPQVVAHDDGFQAPFVGLANRLVSHGNRVNDDFDTEVIFPSRSFGGNLVVICNTVVRDDVEFEAFYSPGYLATLDGVESVGIALSNGDTTATKTLALATIGARSTAQKNTGKYYFECKLGPFIQNGSISSKFGILQEAATYAELAGGNSGVAVALSSTNNSYMYFPSQTSNLGPMLPGDVVGLAVNLDTRRAWFRVNTQVWNNLAGADPALGTNGYSFTPIVTMAPALVFKATTGSIGETLTLNFGSAGFANAAPAGFTPWPGGSNTQQLAGSAVAMDIDGFVDPLVSPTNLFSSFVDDPAENIFLLSGSGGTPTLGPREAVPDDDGFYPAALVTVAATFDPLSRENVTLSNGNLTVTHSNTVNNAGAKGHGGTFRTTGKYYFEVTLSATHGDSDACGLITSVGTFGNLVTNGSQCLATYRYSGNIYSNGGLSGKTLGAMTSGDVVDFAVDLTARKAWLRKNGGNWNGLAIGSENPNTGLGGVTLYPTAVFAPAIGFGGANTAINDAMTANFGSSAYVYAAPAGFLTWGASTPVETKLDVTSSVALSNGNLTATKTDTLDGGARSTAGRTSGKYYFEVSLGLSRGSSDGFGIVSTNSSQPFTDQRSGQNCSSVFCTYNNAAIYSNGSSSFSLGAPMVAGNIIGIAIDLDARRGWFRKGPSGLWNNNATHDPNTGAGGVVITTGQFAPSVCFANTGTAVGDNVTFNFGVTAFSMPVPGGFGKWLT